MVSKLREEDIQLGFQEALSVPETCNSNSELCFELERVDLKTSEPRNERIRRPKVAADPVVPPNSKNRWKVYKKPRHPISMSYGGPGMQAVFLDYTHGTGVFLPRRPDTYFQPSYPVFLPCHVVQALNLLVHVPFNLYQDVKIDNNNNNKHRKVGDRKAEGKKAPKHESSEKIYLPEEWIYDVY